MTLLRFLICGCLVSAADCKRAAPLLLHCQRLAVLYIDIWTSAADGAMSVPAQTAVGYIRASRITHHRPDSPFYLLIFSISAYDSYHHSQCARLFSPLVPLSMISLIRQGEPHGSPHTPLFSSHAATVHYPPIILGKHQIIY